MHGGRCWYIMYCIYISITCTVAGVGILCIVCVSLSHAWWRLLIYYVLYVYLYHMHVAGVGMLCIVCVSLSHARWQVLVYYVLYMYLYHMHGDRCWYIMYCMCISITCTVAGVGILCIVCVSLSHARWQVLVYYVLYLYLYHMHGGRCWYIMYCMCISITCTVTGVGILCIVYVSLSHARWQLLVYYVLYVYLYHMHGGRCWYIMYCIYISITCTVAGVDILCSVCVSLSHARWQVLVYYVLYLYLYHMHDGRCWYIMYCICTSITCTVADVGILCIVFISLSHARWQVLIYYVVYVYLYHMHGDRCWYIM